jgi:hypothetical protein
MPLRKVIRRISAGLHSRIRGPQVPAPRETMFAAAQCRARPEPILQRLRFGLTQALLFQTSSAWTRGLLANPSAP